MPLKNPTKTRPPERDYSHRALIDKLGVKVGQRIAVLGVEDAEFLRDLASRVPEYSRGSRIGNADLIFFFRGGAGRPLAVAISLSFDLQVGWHLGCISTRPKAHSRSRRHQRWKIRRAHRQ